MRLSYLFSQHLDILILAAGWLILRFDPGNNIVCMFVNAIGPQKWPCKADQAIFLRVQQIYEKETHWNSKGYRWNFVQGVKKMNQAILEFCVQSQNHQWFSFFLSIWFWPLNLEAQISILSNQEASIQQLTHKQTKSSHFWFCSYLLLVDGAEFELTWSLTLFELLDWTPRDCKLISFPRN